MDKYIEIFNNYIKDYDMNEYWIKMKYEHTFRVVKFCEEIAKFIGLNTNDIELAKIIGLFHDIGRFEQYKEYKTFVDYKSFDYADYGVDIIERDGYLKDNIDCDLVLKAVKNHNKLKIEDNLTDREILFCNIIRDADKLDILYNIDYSKLDDGGFISSLVFEDIINKRSININNVNTHLDTRLVHVGFVFDFNFKYSVNKLLKDKILNRLIDDILINNKDEESKILIIKDIVLKYMEERGNNYVRN